MLLRLLMYLAPLAGIFGLYRAGRALAFVRIEASGEEAMPPVHRAVRDGALAFLNYELRVLATVAAVVFVVVAISRGSAIGFAFMLGVGCSMLAAYRGLLAATESGVLMGRARGASAEAQARRIGLGGAAATGLSVASLALVGIGALYWFCGDPSGASALYGFVLGASLAALLSRLGGGIYAQAASAGGLRAVVGGVAGRGADLFESHSGAVIVAIAIAAGMSKLRLVALGDHSVEAETLQSQLMVYPLVLSVLGLLASLVGIHALGWLEGRGPVLALRRSSLVAAGVFLIAALAVLATSDISSAVWWAVVAGALGGIVIDAVTERSASAAVERPLKQVSTNAAGELLAHAASGLRSCALPGAAICACLFAANSLAGLYGVAIAAVGMLATVGLTATLDAYTPIEDSARAVSQGAGMAPPARASDDRTRLGADTRAGNGAGLAIGCAALTAVGLFLAYAMAVNQERARQGHAAMQILLTDPRVVIGLFLGGVLPFLLAARCMTAAGRVAAADNEEVARRPQDPPGISDGCSDAGPRDVRRVEESTRRAMRELLVPGLSAACSPLLVGLLLGPEALGGLLVGATLCGVLLALTMAGAGGDGFGDAFEAAAGPSMNVLIKLMSIVSLVLAPLLA